MLFLKLYEKNLQIKFEDFIEKYDNDCDYYSVCFSQEEYKVLFNKDKTSEKELLFDFLEKAYKLKNFDYNNISFKNFIKDLKTYLKKFPDFNQPIEYDCNNDELNGIVLKYIFYYLYEFRDKSKK